MILLAALAVTDTNAAKDDIEAGTKRSCVPNADRSGWECSEANRGNSSAATPAAESSASAPTEAPASSEPPPAMLAAPEEEAAAPLSDFYRVVPETEPSAEPLPETVLSQPQSFADPEPVALAPEPEPIPEPAPAVDTPAPVTEIAPEQPPPAMIAAPEPETPVPTEAPAPEPISEPEPNSEPVSLPVAEAEPVVAPEPVTEPAVSEPIRSEPQVVEAPAVAAPVVATPATTPAATPTPPRAGASAVTGRVTVTSIAGARTFAELDGKAYTLQLADAASPNAFPVLIEQLGLAPDACYLLRVNRDGHAWWLLAHGQYPDVNSAKAALARLPNVAGLTRNWPRKIEYLQREFDPLGP